MGAYRAGADPASCSREVDGGGLVGTNVTGGYRVVAVWHHWGGTSEPLICCIRGCGGGAR